MDSEFEQAVELVDRSGVAGLIGPLVDLSGGRPGTIPARALLVGMALNAMAPHHRGYVAEVARTLVSLSATQLAQLGVRDSSPDTIYKRVDRKYNKIARALESLSPTVRELQLNKIVIAGISPDLPSSTTVAIDGTDVESCARLRSGGEPELDGLAEYPELNPADSTRRRRAAVLGVGPDGRKVYTADASARAGHRSSTNSRAAGPYIGRELHLLVQARGMAWTNNVDRLRLSAPVPAVIRGFSLTPAGAHRSEAAVNAIRTALMNGQQIKEVLWDGGYSLGVPSSNVLPLARLGVQTVFRPNTHQRPARPFDKHSIVVDGGLFSSALPQELKVVLTTPVRGATESEARRMEEKFNARARYRYVRHAPPDAAGYQRFKCPFHAGLLYNRRLKIKRGATRSAPTAALPVGQSSCCTGIASIPVNALPLWQPIPAFTTAHRRSYSRRQIVENVNAALKGQFVNLDRQCFRVFGTTKIALLLAFSLSAYNLTCQRTALAAPRPVPRPRRPRRPLGFAA